MIPYLWTDGTMAEQARAYAALFPGATIDGLWYVKQVTTRITPGTVAQDFDLVRDGLLPTVAKVAA